MGFHPFIAAVLFVIALLVASPAAADATAAKALVADDFTVPVRVETDNFVLVPLGPALVDIDYAAYMSSIEHLQQTFTRSANWPRPGITAAEAMADMENEAARFSARTSFAYGVLSPDGTRERGSLYVSRSPVAGYDAMVRMWVTKADYDAGFDDVLYAWAKDWIAQEWPFAKVAYPGRDIPWDDWEALVKASKPAGVP